MPDPFNKPYKEYFPYVTWLSRKLACGDRDLADDLAQEAWCALASIRPSRWHETRYIHSAMTNAMYRWLRKERAASTIPCEPPSARQKPLRADVLSFPRGTPRPYVHPEVPPPQRRRPHTT